MVYLLACLLVLTVVGGVGVGGNIDAFVFSSAKMCDNQSTVVTNLFARCVFQILTFLVFSGVFLFVCLFVCLFGGSFAHLFGRWFF